MATLDEAGRLGTRFLLYAQVPHVSGYDKPEPVWISTPPKAISAGPSDAKMYVVDPLIEKQRYEFPYLPQFAGAAYPPVEAGPDGHFDHLIPGTRAFVCAHAFGSLRRIQDIWESYLGRPIVWYFRPSIARLEVVPLLDWFNAHSGFGFMEFGVDRAEDGRVYPFALNFDVIAHELGHTILLSELGSPAGQRNQDDFRAYHESASDVVALIALMHFDSVLDRLLRRSQGNLLALNELSRLAELVGDRQIRMVSNDLRMGDTTGEVHNRSRPLTGAIFDTMIETFHRELIARGLFSAPSHAPFDRLSAPERGRMTAALTEAYTHRHFAFKAALADARDAIGYALAASWAVLNPDRLTLADAGMAIVQALADRGNRDSAEILVDNLRWREILPRRAARPMPRPAGIKWRHPSVI